MTPVDLLVAALVESHPAEAARALERLRAGEAAALLAEQAPPMSAAVLARMDAAFAAATLEALEVDAAAAIVADLPPVAVAALLRRVPSATTEAVLAACPPGFAAAVRAVISYPVRSAGALMDPHAPSLPRDLTVSEALAVIRERPARYKHYVYVVDRGGVLVGVARLLDLVAAPPETQLEDLMKRSVVRLHADELEAAVLAHPGWDSYRSLPVVDHAERLLGVIRDDILHAVQQRARGQHAPQPLSLALSLAELLWLGLTGVTEGVAAVVGRGAARDQERTVAREGASEPPP